MFCLTTLGKVNIDKEYPNTTNNMMIMRVIVNCCVIYISTSGVMAIVFFDHMTKEYYYYYTNLATVLIIIHINVNTILTLLTSTSCNLSRNHTYMATVNKGRYKLGIFENGSMFRHLIIMPIINSLIDAFGTISAVILTNAPYNTVTPHHFLLTFLYMLFFNTVYGTIDMITKYSDEDWFSHKPIIIPFFMTEKIDNDVPENDNKDDVIVVENVQVPYYRSLSV